MIRALWAATLCLFLSLFAVPAFASNGDSDVYKLIQARRYDLAMPKLKQMVAQNSRDMSAQYYLGVCAMGLRDFPLAELAFTRVIISSPPQDVFAQAARKGLTSFRSQINPFECLMNNHSMRWAREAMPVKIYFSEGWRVPAGMEGHLMSRAEYKQVTAMLQNYNPSQWQLMPGYARSTGEAVKKGLKSLEWAQKEGLFSFVTVNSPQGADIVVLYCAKTVQEEHSGFTSYPYEWSQPCLIQIVVDNKIDDAQLKANSLTQISAHEFTHAFGLKHSSDPKDLMYPTGEWVEGSDHRMTMVTEHSASDKMCLRALYTMEPDVKFISVQHK
ncbi:MAG: matrixin family metalloprotease [Candidatus Obscuribacter sp.]|jgi:predicted Zn-dependent protease|nr:matrixin family metalloprotease [Candidatus Obscuribacter sp.]